MALITTYTPFKDGDILTPDTLNNVMDTAINANKLTQTPDTSQVNLVGTPSVSIASDGRLVFANLKGEKGNDTKVISTSIMYQSSNSGTTIPTGTWQELVPNILNGYYLWTRTIVTYSDGNSTTSYSVGYKGTNGSNGIDGKNAGFGTITATADSSVGTPEVSVITSGDNTAKNITFQFQNIKGEKGDKGVGFSHYWNGTTLFITTGDTTTSTNLKGEKGDKGDRGIQGIQGIQGLPGSSDMAFEIEQVIYDGSGTSVISNSNITQGWYLVGSDHQFYDETNEPTDLITQYFIVMVRSAGYVYHNLKLNFKDSYDSKYSVGTTIITQKGIVSVDTNFEHNSISYLARLK